MISMTDLTECPHCHSKNIETIGFEHWQCKDCGKRYHVTYHCRICNAEISKERYETHNQLCDFCEDNEEMDEDEDFGIAPHY